MSWCPVGVLDKRRHLTDDQRAIMAAYYKLEHKRAPANQYTKEEMRHHVVAH